VDLQSHSRVSLPRKRSWQPLTPVHLQMGNMNFKKAEATLGLPSLPSSASLDRSSADEVPGWSPRSSVASLDIAWGLDRLSLSLNRFQWSSLRFLPSSRMRRIFSVALTPHSILADCCIKLAAVRMCT
jgi:hypothetical protein